ncbi:MAG: prepilin-type N-terminal cleavage/methylation domain-containing protein [Armatimonadetes bacterium]|nr:prepilin-type N-terminal cleavage/methylation domain-containing protein [Armatimonadota bacterium]
MLRRIKGFTLIELMIVIAIIAILAMILVPNFLKARAQGQYSACQSNAKNIATALEMYSTDNDGHYPVSGATGTALLVSGNYIKTAMPKCPSAGTDTFSAQYKSASNPDTYSFYCTGSSHKQVLGNTDGPYVSDGQVYRLKQ